MGLRLSADPGLIHRLDKLHRRGRIESKTKRKHTAKSVRRLRRIAESLVLFQG